MAKHNVRVNISIPAALLQRIRDMRQVDQWPHGTTSKACVYGIELLLREADRAHFEAIDRRMDQEARRALAEIAGVHRYRALWMPKG